MLLGRRAGGVEEDAEGASVKSLHRVVTLVNTGRGNNIQQPARPWAREYEKVL